VNNFCSALGPTAIRQVTEWPISSSSGPAAWFAARVVESGCEWITTDRDYARFAGLN
jgi:predicted nucleic acid-binding protein